MNEEDWKILHEKERQHNLRLMFQDLPKCKKCNDRGYVTIVYPMKYTTVKPCDCEKAHERFGENTFNGSETTLSDTEYWQTMQLYFGGSTFEETQEIMKQYVKVKRKTRYPKEEIVYEWVKR